MSSFPFLCLYQFPKMEELGPQPDSCPAISKAQYYMQSRNWNLQAGLRKHSKAPNLKCNDSNHLLLLIDFTSSMD